MSELKYFTCLNCGHKFKIEVLTKDEDEALRKKGAPTSPISCEKCHRRDLRPGWD